MQYLGPKIVFTEIDQSGAVPNTPTAIAGIVGRFRRGPTDLTFVTSKRRFKELYCKYGKLEQDLIEQYAACAYLEHDGAGLWVKRVVADDCLFAGVEIVKSDAAVNDNSSLSTGLANPRSFTFSDDGSGNQEGLFLVHAANCGEWGNSLLVEVSDVDATAKTFIITVWEEIDGELFKREEAKVSRDPHAKDGYGRTMYLEKVFENSAYIRIYDNTTLGSDILPKETTSAIAFGGGDDGSTVDISKVVEGWQAFANDGEVEVGILIQGGIGDETLQTALDTIAKNRKDCIAYLDIPYNVTDVSAVLSYRNSTLNIDSSYSALFAPWIRVYDYDNDDSNMYIPPSGVAAGLRAEEDYYFYPWREAAGVPDGVIDCLGLSAYYSQSDRDLLSPAGVNVFIREPGRYVLWDNRTLQKVESALSFIGPRRLLISLRENLIEYSKEFMFKPLTEATRKRFVAGIDDRMRRIKSQEGVYDYRIICDPIGNENGNNPPANVDQGILTCDIFIKPVRAIRFIQIRVTVTRNSVNLSERDSLIER